MGFPNGLSGTDRQTGCRNAGGRVCFDPDWAGMVTESWSLRMPTSFTTGRGRLKNLVRPAAVRPGCGLALFLQSAVLGCAVQGTALHAEEIRTIDGIEVRVERMASGLDTPWGMAFLPSCRLLVTERKGDLWLIDRDGGKHRVAGVPAVAADGQGGLLDIEAAKDFSRTREVFFTYSARMSGGSSGTALSIAELSLDGRTLQNVRLLFKMSRESSGSRHFGSRIVENADGTLFVTIGDRGDRPLAQDLAAHNGKIVRIARDGSVPSDNPFVQQPDALPEIWSFGHRNPQGAALDAKGGLWISDHGPRGGDEINLIHPGRNFGWPEISYGVHYSGRKVGVGIAKEGMEQPLHYWDPSIAPAGMEIYSGRLWPQWRGQLFVGSLKFDYISRLTAENGVREAEQIRLPETRRVRDVEEAPDGTLWFLSEDRRAVYRISPAEWDAETRSGCAW